MNINKWSMIKILNQTLTISMIIFMDTKMTIEIQLIHLDPLRSQIKPIQIDIHLYVDWR